MKSALAKAAHEVGLKAFLNSPRDIKILCLQRFVRLTAYGASTLILVLFLVDLGNSVSRTGLFMTLTLIGDVFVSLLLTMVADRLGRRVLLGVGSLLMTASGLVFASVDNFWILLLASVLGVISPGGNEVGPFKAIEESTIAQLTPSPDRSSILAWYTLFGTAGVALGTITCGWVVRVLQQKHDWQPIQTYRLTFAAYAILGIVKFLLCLLLSQACEVENVVPSSQTDDDDDNDEQQPLLADDLQHTAPARRFSVMELLPNISREARSLIVKLGILFAMDSLASGLSPASWMIYFFSSKFGLAEEKLGTLFFVTSIVSSPSSLAATSLTRRIGLIKAMVFTHAPASIALALIPVPSNVLVAMGLLIFRASINSMDQAPRQAFLAAALLPEERTSVMGVMNMVKTLSQSMGPVITGRLAGSGRFWVAFVIAGSLKILYDVLLLGMFLGYRTVEDKAQASVAHETGREQLGDSIQRREEEDQSVITLPFDAQPRG